MLAKTTEAKVLVDEQAVIVAVIFNLPKFRCYHVTCYIVAQGQIPEIDRGVRMDAVKKLVKDAKIPAALGRQMIKEIKG